MGKRIFYLFLGIAVLGSSSSLVQAATWSSEGTQILSVNTGMGDDEMTRFVAPGSDITIQVFKLEDWDTKCPDTPEEEEEEDDQKQGKLYKSGGNCPAGPGPAPGAWIEHTFSSPTTVSWTVPTSGVSDGMTIEISSQISDTRNIPEARHDEWSTIHTWTFIISTDCPDDLIVDGGLVDLSGSLPPPGASYGKWRATMEADGTPPAGRSNWDGTMLNETYTPFDCDSQTEWIAGIDGHTIGTGGSFMIGSAATNKFYDYHVLGVLEPPTLLLRDGVNSATGTTTQTYDCSTESYSFDLTYTANRLDAGEANERIKITIEK